ncbi:ATP-binding protein [Streptomyces sp. NBC_01565]|uniref:ATP-binding protein n=1 Tax=unclassified Streptomyces TaxID=2593676 RepID=UPI002251D58D|nr:ATP-binding protein [Streptomyces sp. NBC_01565]MCX4545679.1 ATP-binding protein [Streptomyces sp. NBC_01565]
MAPPIQHLELPRHPGAAIRAREAASQILGDAVSRGQRVTPAAADIALLIVSELVTNAVRHTRGPCTLDLKVGDGAIDIKVTDSSPTPPEPRPPHVDGTGGWGWILVNHLARQITVRPSPHGGKIIHALIPTTV